jgi:hypothetical protein
LSKGVEFVFMAENRSLIPILPTYLPSFTHSQWNSDQKKPPKSSWKDFYFGKPLVPVDFSTIQQALAASADTLSPSNLTILLRSGTHYVTNPICIETAHSNSKITIAAVNSNGCDNIYSHSTSPPQIKSFCSDTTNTCDQPLFHVAHGRLDLQGLGLCHESYGADLWNGNAAVYIRPSASERQEQVYLNEDVEQLPLASVVIQQCSIQSSSGRGVSVMGNSSALVSDSLIHSCAATGVYVAGEDAIVNITNTDILRNGQGNVGSGGVRRMHSGLYLEAGKVSMQDCTVAQNTATGISVVAGATLLKLLDSDVMGNERAALDIPLRDWGRHVVQGNNELTMVANVPRTRSSVLRQAPELVLETKGNCAIQEQATLMEFLRAESLL